jgi:hypothetical protein
MGGDWVVVAVSDEWWRRQGRERDGDEHEEVGSTYQLNKKSKIWLNWWNGQKILTK